VTERIPRVFHFVYGLRPQTEPLHLIHYLCIESCLRINRPERIYFYHHYQPYGRYWDLVKDKVVSVKVELPAAILNYRYADRGIEKYRYAHLSDVVRLEQILTFGGVYADIDTIFVNAIPDALFDRPFVLGEEADVYSERTRSLRPSVCNAFMMSSRDSEFGRIWLREMLGAFDGSWSEHSCFLAKALSLRYPQLVHVEPARTFYKHMWTREGLHTLLAGCDPDFDGVVSMHLWSHLWWDKGRRDFSNLHAGMFTERHIRSVDTTYNLAARPFLPPAETTGRVRAALARLSSWSPAWRRRDRGRDA
jgi:hypothetical protein